MMQVIGDYFGEQGCRATSNFFTARIGSKKLNTAQAFFAAVLIAEIFCE